MVAFFARRTYDAQLALDLTAETFAQAFSGRRRFRGDYEEKAAAWLFTIANRQLARYWRRGRAEQRAVRRLGLQVPPTRAPRATSATDPAYARAGSPPGRPAGCSTS